MSKKKNDFFLLVYILSSSIDDIASVTLHNVVQFRFSCGSKTRPSEILVAMYWLLLMVNVLLPFRGFASLRTSKPITFP